MAGVTELQLADLSARLDNLEVRSQKGTPVAPGTKYPSTCSENLLAENSRCLVDYHYPMSFEETVEVANKADFAPEDDSFSIESSEGVKKTPLPPFQPDWRFWTGVTLSGLGLFFYRNR